MRKTISWLSMRLFAMQNENYEDMPENSDERKEWLNGVWVRVSTKYTLSDHLRDPFITFLETGECEARFKNQLDFDPLLQSAMSDAFEATADRMDPHFEKLREGYEKRQNRRSDGFER